MLKPLVFPDAGTARAAFALGPLVYRCSMCGQQHRSGNERGRQWECLIRAVRELGWSVPDVALPPRPLLTPAYAFAAVVWENIVGAACWDLKRRQLPPEYLLAVEPGAGLAAALEEELEGRAAERRAAAREAWSKHVAFYTWLSELRQCRPPAFVEAAEERKAADDKTPCLGQIVIRPAVKPPFKDLAWVEMTATDLKHPISRRLDRYGLVHNLVGACYTSGVFQAVFVAFRQEFRESRVSVWVPEWICRYREYYDGQKEPELAALPARGQDIAAAVKELMGQAA